MASADDPEILRRVRSGTAKELSELAAEIRAEIKAVTEASGGHLGASLGAVEIALAVHRAFESPDDRIIWDTGHQSFPHKIITGRSASLKRLRLLGGASGYPSVAESEHDAFGTGHASTGIAAGCGLAALVSNPKRWVVVVVGDAALAGGPALEALLLVRRLGPRMCIVVNDNGFSIMPSVASLADVEGSVRSLAGAAGLPFLGPLDGHSVSDLCEQFAKVREGGLSTLIHVRTRKGAGDAAAATHPLRLHAIEPAGTSGASGDTFQARIVGVIKEALDAGLPLKVITAAMGAGFGIQQLLGCYPQHCIDVGIAEGFSATFAAALRLAGFRVLLHVYSTFLMRCADQLIHDVGLQSCAVTVIVDRIGFSGAEGPTHHGIYDLAVLTAIPNARIYSGSTPATAASLLRGCLGRDAGVSVIRVPKGGVNKSARNRVLDSCDDWLVHRKGDDIILITYGRPLDEALAAAEALALSNIQVQVIELVRLYPLNAKDVRAIGAGQCPVLFVEEHVESGSIGLHFMSLLRNVATAPWKHLCVRNPIVAHGSLSEQWDLAGLSARHIVAAATALKDASNQRRCADPIRDLGKAEDGLQ